jgi:hypothetical protein
VRRRHVASRSVNTYVELQLFRVGAPRLEEPENLDTSDSGPWDTHRIVSRGLDEIVRAFGPDALSEPRTLENRLSDVVPEGQAQKETNLAVSASRHRIAAEIERAVSEGLGPEIAVRYATQRLHDVEAFELSACEWVARAFAAALGHRADPTAS